MKKLTLGLVFLFVCGMVGEAGAALVTPNPTETFLGGPQDGSYFDVGGTGSKTANFNFNLNVIGTTDSTVNSAQNNGASPYTKPTDDYDVSNYKSNLYTITGAKLYYTLSDQDTAKEQFVLKIVDGNYSNIFLDKSGGNYYLSDTTTRKELTDTYTLSPTDLAYLKDGILSVQVVTNGGRTVRVDQIKLELTAQTVPLPAAGLLLCSGLIGLICVRRKQTI